MTDGHDAVKRKIRKLKKVEIKIRLGNTSDLVWDEFFDLNSVSKKNARYSLNDLAAMSRDEFKNVVEEYFFFIYYRYYKENGMIAPDLYDPGILEQMGLPLDADGNAVKKRFRELAKKYHPDTGGDSSRFIEMMENYRKLTKC
jgi:hypothetical protein